MKTETQKSDRGTVRKVKYKEQEGFAIRVDKGRWYFVDLPDMKQPQEVDPSELTPMAQILPFEWWNPL